ncbi:MAG TPA: phosphoribosylanthranilate isomerase, partial [Rubrobacteraceae bacterium]|nr:phosphoribosylanthranilate isomerase [Rubrobacteraceae bacterium]
MMVKVKVCGITTPEDARFTAESGADAIGLVFAQSPRRVGVERAREISAALPKSVLKVGVFVDEEPEVVLRIASEVDLYYAQLHGGETPEAVSTVRNSGLKVIKALHMRDAASL